MLLVAGLFFSSSIYLEGGGREGELGVLGAGEVEVPGDEGRGRVGHEEPALALEHEAVDLVVEVEPLQGLGDREQLVLADLRVVVEDALGQAVGFACGERENLSI